MISLPDVLIQPATGFRLAAFFLYADEGGIPPANKVKVKPEKGQEVKLITTEVGYHLKEGDQIILGESALLEFSYSADNN